MITTIPKQITNLFNPPKLTELKEISFKTALEAVNRQRTARIVKAALFAISSAAATITLVLTEASLITTSLTIPTILIAVVTGGIFYRLNSLDKRYIEGLNDPLRSDLAKNELERIFLSKTPVIGEFKKSLNDLNRFLGTSLFEPKIIEQILTLQKNGLIKEGQSIAEAALENNISLKLAFTTEWSEQGHYGLPSYDGRLEVHWDGSSSSIQINYKKQETGKEGLFAENLEINPELNVNNTAATLP